MTSRHPSIWGAGGVRGPIPPPLLLRRTAIPIRPGPQPQNAPRGPAPSASAATPPSSPVHTSASLVPRGRGAAPRTGAPSARAPAQRSGGADGHRARDLTDYGAHCHRRPPPSARPNRRTPSPRPPSAPNIYAINACHTVNRYSHPQGRRRGVQRHNRQKGLCVVSQGRGGGLPRKMGGKLRATRKNAQKSGNVTEPPAAPRSDTSAQGTHSAPTRTRGGRAKGNGRNIAGKLRKTAEDCGTLQENCGKVRTPPPPRVTFRRVVAPLRGPGQSPVLPFECFVGSLRSVGCCGRCS